MSERPNKLKDISKYLQWLLYLIITTGITLRIVVYFQNRSLFLDESNVARNIAEKGYAELFLPLDYDQFMPPLFAVSIKACTDIFGNDEFALRLLPLLMGVATVIMFYHFSKHLIHQPIALLLVNWVFSCSYLLIQYSTEAKQYGTDALLTMTLLLIAMRTDINRMTVRKWALWAVGGAVVIWCSMPSVFILFAVGIYLFLQFWKQFGWNVSKSLGLIFVIMTWLFSFGVYYKLNLSQGVSSQLQQSYHQSYFLPFFPTSLGSAEQWLSIQQEIMRATIGKTVVALAFGAIFMILGNIVCYKKQKAIWCLLTLPILVVWIASSMGQYSLLPRLALFYMPISLVFIGIGIGWAWERTHSYLKWLLLLLLIVVASHQWGYRMFWRPLHIDEIKPVLSHVADVAEANDYIYVHHEAVAAFQYYTQYHKEKATIYHLDGHPRIETTWRDAHPKLPSPLPERIWLLFSHSDAEIRTEVRIAFYQQYTETESFESIRASCYLLELKK